MKGPRWAGRLAVAAGIAGLCAGTFVAGQQTVRTADAATRVAQETAPAQLWTAKEESVGRTLRLPASLTTVGTPGPLVHLDGVVTAVTLTPGAEVAAGDVLFEIAGRPVHAGAGAVPAYRTLEPGTTGEDVRQLRHFLCSLKALAACRSSSTFDDDVAAAVQAWHRRSGRSGDSVALGEIMWFPTLPTRLAATDKLTVGAAVAAGDRPVDVESGAVQVQLVVSRDQAALVPAGTPASLGPISGVTGEPEPTPDKPDAFALPLLTAAGQPLCSDPAPCRALLGTAGQRALEVSLAVIPERTGIGVPTKAVQTAADGSTSVVTVDGGRRPVTVLQSAGGLTLVDGLPAGTPVRLSGGARD
jgi:hypothetical protein